MVILAGKYYYLTLGLLLFLTVVGLTIAVRFQREVEHDLAPPTEKDLFDPLEKAFYAGLMDEAEFRRIKASMERQKLGDPIPIPKKSPRILPEPDPEISPGSAPE